jgi:predicted exporter
MVWIVLGGFVLAVMAGIGVAVVSVRFFLLWLLGRHLVRGTAAFARMNRKEQGPGADPRQPISH